MKEQIIKTLQSELTIATDDNGHTIHVICEEDIPAVANNLEPLLDAEVERRIAERMPKIRQVVADYMFSEGCSCCENIDDHRKHKKRLGKLLNVEMYPDKSGYDFSKYRSPKRVSGHIKGGE